MKVAAIALTLFMSSGSAILVAAQAAPDGMHQHESGSMAMHDHAAGAPVSYTELKATLEKLERARQSTAKYKDVRVAESDGYRAIGPDVPGMGLHYVLSAEQNGFDITKPPILLYEKDASVPGGYALVGVSYLLNAPEGPDGQPLNAPFPKSLAVWHRHENICVLPDRSTPHGLSEQQCVEKGGHFTGETQWMVHAWIWKDSPQGVFSPKNSSVM